MRSETDAAAGSLIVVLLWVYYSAQILFFGAEFTQVYANRFGSRVVPDADAVPVTDEARAQQGMPRQEQVGAVARGGSLARDRAGEQHTQEHSASSQHVSAGRHMIGGQPSAAQAARSLGVTIGVAGITLIVGLLLGAASSLIGVVVGAVLRVVGALRRARH